MGVRGRREWAKIPDEIVLGDCAAVGVDSKDNVYAFNRGDHPIAVFDNDGNLLRTWGEGVFTRPHSEPHGVHMAPDDTIWLTDDGDHTVRQCTLDGQVLLTIGIPGKPSPFMSGDPFHHCTHTALSPECDYLYISDGYGNARIHKFTLDGKLLSSWGEPGTDPGQFNIPHNICCDPEGWIYVADRENHRVQVFDANGKWEHSGTTSIGQTACAWGAGKARSATSAKAGRRAGATASGRISAARQYPYAEGRGLGAAWQTPGGFLPGQFTTPHGIAVDSQGNIYVGELSGRSWPRFSKGPVPEKRRVIHRLRKITA